MAVIKVRMKIFSGVRDPEWMIEKGEDQKRIIDFLAQAKRLSAQVKQHKQDQRSEIPERDLPVTGYRGFEVTVDGKMHRVFLDQLVHMASAATRQVEKVEPETIDRFLFGTQASVLMQRYGLTAQAVQAPTALHTIAGLSATTCDTSPLEIGHAYYRPSSWSPDPFNDNTCYGYAANVRTEDVVFPDDKADRDQWSRDQLIDALRADGFGNPTLQVPNASTNSNGGHFLVALLELRGTDKGDFHFLRLDHSGTWSQKVSTDPVTQRDQQTPKRKLTDLCAAQFFSAFTFVGFFVINDAVQNTLRQRGNP